ncbi:MAG: DUF1553 domain-containing protein [Acidobacteriota bacterium]|nr:DUF1549 and DUF1553 domain-containing protein [Blastocatellia bacterium]MDW8412149.1 DUF1553 domain-containing protein [Acidobacteriota bacterium]
MKRVVLFTFLALLVVQLQPIVQNASQRQARLAECQYDTDFLQRRISEASATATLVSNALKPLKVASKEVKQAQSDSQTNLIDVYIFSSLAQRGIKPAPPATDEEFCRRIYLDLTGKQPSPQQLQTFLADKSANKREALVDQLIGSAEYIDKWTNWIGDWVRNHDVDFNFRRKDLNSTYLYIKGAVSKNLPIDQLAKDFITYSGVSGTGPASFITYPFYFAPIPQDAYDDAAAETLKTFFGVPAVCISCHDGEGHLEPINLYLSQRKRAEYWGIAAFFSQTTFKFNDEQKSATIGRNPALSAGYYANTKPGEGNRPARTGGRIEPSFELFAPAKIDFTKDPRFELARLVTSHPQFARAFVNRIFAEFFTLALVEPVDGFDLARLDPKAPPQPPWTLQPSNPELLEALTEYFRKSGFDMRKLIRLIVTSEAYGLSSRYDEKLWQESYATLYARKLPRRLSAEEVLDAITTATKVPGAYYAIGFDKLFTSTMSLPGVESPDYEKDVKQSDPPYLVHRFLETFGRGNRRSIQRSNKANLSQILALLNNQMLIDRLSNENSLVAELTSKLQRGNLQPRQAVQQLYMATLGRTASSEEIEILLPLIKADRKQLARIQAALFNQPDFLYNY